MNTIITSPEDFVGYILLKFGFVALCLRRIRFPSVATAVTFIATGTTGRGRP